MTIPHHPKQNHLLAALPEADYERLLPSLEWISMPLGKVLCEPSAQLSYVYFPTTAIVSLSYVMENGATAEIAGVGNEGVVGVSLFMGGVTTPSRAFVHTAGAGYRIKANMLLEEFNRIGGRRSGALHHLLLRYTQTLITQMSQTAVCNRHHSVDQQLCRWLLLTLDRLPSNELIITQELIASMLGVRRESITEAAGKLQREEVIRYSRGRIEIIERAGLEHRVCECYSVVKKEFDHLISDVATLPVNAGASANF